MRTTTSRRRRSPFGRVSRPANANSSHCRRSSSTPTRQSICSMNGTPISTSRTARPRRNWSSNCRAGRGSWRFRTERGDDGQKIDRRHRLAYVGTVAAAASEWRFKSAVTREETHEYARGYRRSGGARSPERVGAGFPCQCSRDQSDRLAGRARNLKPPGAGIRKGDRTQGLDHLGRGQQCGKARQRRRDRGPRVLARAGDRSAHQGGQARWREPCRPSHVRRRRRDPRRRAENRRIINDGIRMALLAAKTIAYSAGPSGAHMAALIQKWGIVDKVKLAAVPTGTPVGEVIARGDADIGFQQISELLPVKGIDYLGPLPADIQEVTVFAAALHKAADSTDAARALLRFMTAPEAVPVIRKAGMEPG